MNETYEPLISDPDGPELEAFLDWQVDACDDDKSAEFLQENRDRHTRQARNLEGQVTEENVRQSEATRHRRTIAWLAVRRAIALILKNNLVNAQLNKVRAEYQSKRDGKELDIPDVNLDKLRHDILKEQREKLREICDSAPLRNGLEKV